jgi:lon-related putative ATP-dependent protease
MIKELSPDQLRRTIDPKSLGIQSTKTLKSLTEIIGQERAVSAIQFGLGIQKAGYNIYVAGPPGIGKMTAVESFLKEVATSKETPPDWCYVNNFDEPYQPRMMSLPAGKGRQFQQDLKALIEHIRREIPKVFESEEYGTRKDQILKDFDRVRTEVLEQVHEKATQSGFQLKSTPVGIMIIPVLSGRTLSDSEFQALPESARKDIQEKRKVIEEELKEAMKQTREMERVAQGKIQEFDKSVTLNVVGELLDDLIEKYRDLPRVMDHLKEIQKDILENIDLFRSVGEAPREQKGGENKQQAPWKEDLSFRKYQVNLLVDNSKQEGAPVTVELNPSYGNLFGRVEKESHFGALYTDFTMIKPGSLHKANGGYLVVPTDDLLRNYHSWDGLKRSLRCEEIQIEELSERLGYMTTKSLRPQPIPLDVKVVLVGRTLLYYLLHSHDEEFPEIFKVKADFDTQMDRNEKNTQDFLAFLNTLCEKENLIHFDKNGVVKILEYASRLAEDQEKLSTHFGAIANLIREANYWAKKDGADYITEIYVKKALDEKIYRSNLIQERMKEMVERGTILIDTKGDAIGQVNGLSVLTLGDYLFGKPSRITASVGPGREGIIDIEREVELSGPIHSKGVLILNGYLTQKFALERPLTLSARLVFEQSYQGVDGDSASSTELYAILSALSGLSIKQDIAVTGSVNQKGEIQAIGGANHKIEGFFDLCSTEGLNSSQGVIIPPSNVQNLMLREDVVEAVRDKKFHIWTAKTIDDGIEILTGTPAGKRNSDNKFPEGTVNHLVDERLKIFAESIKEFSRER